MSVPPSLKFVQPTLARAAELDEREPVIAYFCRLHAVQQILAKNLHQIDPEAAEFSSNLLDVVESAKSSPESPLAADKYKQIIDDDDTAQAYVEYFALKVFAKADHEVRSKQTTKATPSTFLAAAVFLDVLRVFQEPLDTAIADKIKYAKFQAARILKAYKSGEDPNDYEPEPEPEQLLPEPGAELGTDTAIDEPVSHLALGDGDRDGDNGSNNFENSGGNGFEDNGDNGDTLGYGNNDDSYGESQGWQSGLSAEANPFSPLGTAPAAPDPARATSATTPASSANIAALNLPSAPPVLPEAPSEAPRGEHGATLPSAPVLPPNIEPEVVKRAPPSQPKSPQSSQHLTRDTVSTMINQATLVTNAQKHAKYAISALNYEDIETATEELQKALELLGHYNQ